MPVKLNEEGQYEIQFSQGGRRVHRVLPKGATRKQAIEKEVKLKREIFDADELGHEQDHTIGEGIMRYLAEYHGKAKRQTESHAKSISDHVKGRSLSELSTVAPGIATLSKITRSTRNRRLAILRRVANLAYGRWGWIKSHIKVELLPENPARQVYLTRDELAVLLRKIKNKKYRKVCYAAAFTGLRKGELLGLEPDDIRGNVICLADTKTGSPRNVPIIRKARFAFNRLPFRLDPYGLSRAVQKASGGKVRFHDFRHTTASLLINAGVPLYTVGAILGHKSVQTTKRYAHLDIKSTTTAMEKLEPTRQLPAETLQKKSVANG